MPILEAGLSELVAEGLDSGRLRFVVGARPRPATPSSCSCACRHPSVTVAAPTSPFVEDVVREIAPVLQPGAVIVNKSTMPVGSTLLVTRVLGQNGAANDIGVASNPEFLREAHAVRDFLHTSRIVIGCDDTAIAVRVSELYKGLQAPLLVTDPASAEMIKYASNAFLATKISFVNAIANLCEAVNADVRDVALGMGYDPRIGSEFLQAGPGYGGSCLPKDVAALVHTAAEAGYDFALLRGVVEVNEQQRDRVIAKIATGAGGSVAGARIAVWGLTFKANTDDLRDSPALAIVSRLVADGAEVRAYDPILGDPSVAVPAAATRIPGVEVVTDPYEAADGASRAHGAHRVARVPLARLHARARRDDRSARDRRRPQPARPVGDAPPRLRLPGRRPLMPRAVVTGGSGFVGSHLCRALLARGWDVVAVDNFITGRRDNVEDLITSRRRRRDSHWSSTT